MLSPYLMAAKTFATFKVHQRVFIENAFELKLLRRDRQADNADIGIILEETWKVARFIVGYLGSSLSVEVATYVVWKLLRYPLCVAFTQGARAYRYTLVKLLGRLET